MRKLGVLVLFIACAIGRGRLDRLPLRHRARPYLPRKLRNQRKTKRKTRIKRKKINHPARTYLARAPRGSNPINQRQRKSIRTRLFLIQPRTWASLAAV